MRDGPFDVSRQDIAEWRAQAGDALSTFVSSGRGALASGALVAGEVVVGGLLSLVVTFFFLKDGRRMVDAALERVPAPRGTLPAALPVEGGTAPAGTSAARPSSASSRRSSSGSPCCSSVPGSSYR